MPRLPFDVSKAVNAWKEVSTTANLSANLMLAGDDCLVARAQERFATGGTLPAVWNRPVSEIGELVTDPGDVLVLFVSAEDEDGTLATLSEHGLQSRVVLAVDEGADATNGVTYPVSGLARLSFVDSGAGWRRLFELCAENAGDNVVALGRRYPALRAAAARRVIYRAAGRNALLGLAFFVPGADMPAMTLNQAKMVLSVAGIFGEEIGRDRAVELAGVLGAGLVSRGLARSFLKSSGRGTGWAIKASVGFAVTLALGLAAIKYFEKGAPASTGRVMALAGSLRR